MGLGNSLYASGDRRAAAAVFRTAAQRHHSAPAWINLAQTLLDLGEANAALQAARVAAALDDAAWREPAQAMLARVQAAIGRE